MILVSAMGDDYVQIYPKTFAKENSVANDIYQQFTGSMLKIKRNIPTR